MDYLPASHLRPLPVSSDGKSDERLVDLPVVVVGQRHHLTKPTPLTERVTLEYKSCCRQELQEVLLETIFQSEKTDRQTFAREQCNYYPSILVVVSYLFISYLLRVETRKLLFIYLLLFITNK